MRPHTSNTIADPGRDIVHLMAHHSVPSAKAIASAKYMDMLTTYGITPAKKRIRERILNIKSPSWEMSSEWLENFRKFWEQRFSKLDALLEELKLKKKNNK